jgi:hypothetical protein
VTQEFRYVARKQLLKNGAFALVVGKPRETPDEIAAGQRLR